MSDDADFGHSDVDTEFGRELLASVREALAHKRGEIELPYRVYEINETRVCAIILLIFGPLECSADFFNRVGAKSA